MCDIPIDMYSQPDFQNIKIQDGRHLFNSVKI